MFEATWLPGEDRALTGRRGEFGGRRSRRADVASEARLDGAWMSQVEGATAAAMPDAVIESAV